MDPSQTLLHVLLCPWLGMHVHHARCDLLISSCLDKLQSYLQLPKTCKRWSLDVAACSNVQNNHLSVCLFHSGALATTKMPTTTRERERIIEECKRRGFGLWPLGIQHSILERRQGFVRLKNTCTVTDASAGQSSSTVFNLCTMFIPWGPGLAQHICVLACQR